MAEKKEAIERTIYLEDREIELVCPICGKEMEKGAILIYDNRHMEGPVWYPEAECKKKGIGTLRRDGEIYIGYPDEYRGLTGENQYEAYYCENCKKIIAHFDIRE